MALLGILLATGLVAGIAVTPLVYVDCVRRGMASSGSLYRALACGVGSSAGFLVPYVLSRELRGFYFQVLKPQAIAVTPLEWISINLAAGLVIGVGVVTSYLVGSRLQGGKQAETG